jgi:ATP-binding cassette subfamily C exporter for protease/lipase
MATTLAPRAAIGEITTFLGGFKSQFLAVAFFSGVINLLYLSPAIYMLQVYDRVLNSHSESTLLALTLLVFGLFIVIGLLEMIRGGIMANIGNALDDHFSSRVYRATFMRQFNEGGTQASQPLSDLNQLRQFFSGGGIYALLDLPWLPIFLVTIFLLHPWLGWFALMGAGLMFAGALISERLARHPLTEAGHWSMAAQGLASSQLRNAEVVSALGMLGELSGRWRALQKKARDYQQIAYERMALTGGSSRVARLMLQSGVLGLGAYLAIQGQISPGAMIAAAILTTRAMAPLESIIGHWKTLLQNLAGYRRLNKLLADFPEASLGIELPRPRGELSFENVFVAPPGSNQYVLKGLSFSVSAGETLGIIGPSAAGKSTLARAMIGIWPAALGKARIDGSDLSQWDRDRLGGAIGYLPQDIELFSGTVAENIARFGDLDSEKIVAAASICGIHDMILRLPQGYETLVGEAGGMLSGGQRQLVALARAVYGEPSLVVLDEPSASLDEAGLRALIGTIAHLKKQRITTILITHDMRLLKATDKLLALQGGAIRDFGPSTEVFDRLKAKAS